MPLLRRILIKTHNLQQRNDHRQEGLSRTKPEEDYSAESLTWVQFISLITWSS